MVRRCTDPFHPSYKNYGGRGISYPEAWRKVAGFMADMGERPPGMTLDRLDNEAGYSPANCRWATKTEQAANRRNAVVLTAAHLSLSLAEWADLLGYEHSIIRKRPRMGWPIPDALFKPIAKRTKSSPIL
jgi:hypothetical protein